MLCSSVHDLILNDIPGLINLHNILVKQQDYNFRELRIPIFSKLNIEFWRDELQFYDDKDICDFLQFGFPLSFQHKEGLQLSHSKLKNHTGARNFAKDIEKYIKKEISYGAVM